MRQRCIGCLNGYTKVPYEDCNGRASLVADELVMKIDNKICENPHFTITEILQPSPNISQNFVYEIVAEKLGSHKFCAWWVPKILTRNHEKHRLAAALRFLKDYKKNCDKVVD